MSEVFECAAEDQEAELRRRLGRGVSIRFAPPEEDPELAKARAARTIPADWIQDLVRGEDATVPRRIDIAHAVIDGPLDLRHISFAGEFSITESEFTAEVDLEFASFVHGFRIDGSRFRQPVNLHGATITGDLTATKAVFNRGVILDDLSVTVVLDASGARFGNLAECRRIDITQDALFVGATFHEDAHFSNCHVRGVTRFQDVRFGGKADFEEAQMEGSGYFGSNTGITVFEGQATFDDVRFGASANFSGAQFKDEATFTDTQFAKDVYFWPGVQDTPVVFEGAASFLDAQVGGSALFNGAQFKDEASFHRTTIGGDAFFRPDEQGTPVVFEKSAEFIGTRFAADADFRSTRFRGHTSFTAAEALHEIHFEGAAFRQGVMFREARFRVVHFNEEVVNAPRWPWSLVRQRDRISQFHGGVDLRGFAYERIYVDWGEFLHKLYPYDRQPFTQMEAALRQMGEDRGADDVYYERRLREFRIRRGWQHRGEWLRRYLVDLPYRLFAGYGVRPLRFLAVVMLFLMVGMLVFRQSDAVVPRSEAERQASAGQLVDVDWILALQVSLDQLLPSPVDIPGGRRWEPSSNVLLEIGGVTLSYAGYASIQSIVGWLLVPVGITFLAGVLRRQP